MAGHVISMRLKATLWRPKIGAANGTQAARILRLAHDARQYARHSAVTDRIAIIFVGGAEPMKVGVVEDGDRITASFTATQNVCLWQILLQKSLVI